VLIEKRETPKDGYLSFFASSNRGFIEFALCVLSPEPQNMNLEVCSSKEKIPLGGKNVLTCQMPMQIYLYSIFPLTWEFES